jgi:hypothetical protein
MPLAMQVCASVFNKGNSRRMPVFRETKQIENQMQAKLKSDD